MSPIDINTIPVWKLALWRFFPLPVVPPMEEGAAYIQSELLGHFSWKDRLRVLFTGRLVTYVRVQVSAQVQPVGETQVMQFVPRPGTTQ